MTIPVSSRSLLLLTRGVHAQEHWHVLPDCTLVSDMPQIHSTALVDPQADLHESVAVGPCFIVGPNVRIGAGTTIGPHCVIEGHTTLGEDNRIFQFASIGAAPQDKKYRGEATRLEIGDGNAIREFVTINTGTLQDTGLTRLGDDNWIMAYVHIAHDCVLGSHIIMANSATLGGHVHRVRDARR